MDYLKIQNEENELNLPINFGYVDRTAVMFDFKHNEHINLTGYNLSLDIENTDRKTLLELEKIIHAKSPLINAIISLDGIISRGKAKIAQIFSFNGLSYDVEIIN